MIKVNKHSFSTNKLLSKKGFTLIELLVVIAIIGILATIIVASFTSAQQRGRDARRKADLDAVKKALELAKSDCTGGKWYVLSSGVTAVERYSGTTGDNLMEILQDPDLGYIKLTPNDPSRSAANGYHYFLTGTVSTSNVCRGVTGAITEPGYPGFVLSTILENANDSGAASSATSCGITAAGDPGFRAIPAGITGVAYYTCSD